MYMNLYINKINIYIYLQINIYINKYEQIYMYLPEREGLVKSTISLLKNVLRHSLNGTIDVSSSSIRNKYSNK